MSNSKATMTVRPADAQTSVIAIQGELNGEAEAALMSAYTEATNDGSLTIILDFNPLEYMNSSGIGLLVTLLIRVNRQKQQLLAIGLSEHYRRIFELTRLNEAIKIYDNESDAIAAAGTR
jgi:anti-sigma B factor antagonist